MIEREHDKGSSALRVGRPTGCAARSLGRNIRAEISIHQHFRLCFCPNISAYPSVEEQVKGGLFVRVSELLVMGHFTTMSRAVKLYDVPADDWEREKEAKIIDPFLYIKEITTPEKRDPNTAVL